MAITKIIRQNKKNLTVILPCAGLSRRMRKGPKSLLEIDGEKLIVRQLRILKSLYPQADFVVVVGYGADEVISYLPKNVRVVWNERYEETNIVHSLSLGLRASITENILIVYGDLVFNRKTFLPIEENSCLLLNKEGKNDCIGANIENNFVEHLVYTSKNKWGHIAYLTGKELELFKLFIHNKDYEKLFASEIINFSIERGAKFEAIYTQGPLIELDTVADFVKMKIFQEEL